MLHLEEYVGLAVTVAAGVLIGLIASYAIFAAVAWVQDWWKYR